MGFMRRIGSYSLVAATLLVLVGQVRAQGVIDMGGMPDQEAKSHFKVGKSLYETGRFSEAAVEFEKAYQLSRKVELLYNVYVAHRDASDLPKAIDALRRYLELAQIDESARLNLQARLRAMEEANGRAATTPAAPAPESQPEQPAAEPAPVQPAPPAPVPEPPSGSAELEVEPDSAVLPYALIGIGSGALLAGVVTAIMAAGQISDIEDACPDDVCPPPADFDLEGERDSASSLRTVAFALIGGGVVLGGAGLTLLLLDSGDEAPAQSGTQAGVRCGGAGCMGVVSGRF